MATATDTRATAVSDAFVVRTPTRRFELTDDVVVVLRGDGAEEVAKATNLSSRPGTVRPAGDAFVIGRDDGALDIVGPPELIDDIHGLLTDNGAREGSPDDLEAWRIAAGVRAWGTGRSRPRTSPKRWACCRATSTSPRGATPARKPSPGCGCSAGRVAAWPW